MCFMCFLQGVGVCERQTAKAGEQTAANQRSQGQVPESEERAGADETTPDAGASQVDLGV